MRKINVFVLVFLFAVSMTSTLSAQSVTQEYPIGKVFLATGMTIEGSNVKLTMETVTITIQGMEQVYLLEDVVQVMAKQGKAKKFGANCAGACIGFNLGSWLASGGVGVDADGEEYDINPGQMIISTALWGGISYGIGYLAGKVSDDWEVVYLKR